MATELNDLQAELKKVERAEAKALRKKFSHKVTGLWEFQKYMDSSLKHGYTDDQIDCKLVSMVLCLGIHGIVKNIGISMPRRRKKSHAINDALKLKIGLHPSLANARYSYSEKLVLKHSKMIKDEVEGEKFSRIFTQIKKITGGLSEWQTNLCDGEPTFHCAGVGGGATGNGVNGFLVGDDMLKGFKEAHSPAVMGALDVFVSGNFESCDEDGMVLAHIGTRWIDNDPIGNMVSEADKEGYRIFKFDAYETKLTEENVRTFIQEILTAHKNGTLDESDVVQISIPALDKDDETTCPWHPKYTSRYYLKRRKRYKTRGLEHIWSAMYQQLPIAVGSMLFNDFSNFYTFSMLKRLSITSRNFYIDTAGRGQNKTCCGEAIVSGDNIFILPDIIYTPEEPKKSKLEVIRFLKKNNRYKRLHNLVGESNNGGDQYCESIEEKLEDEGINISIDLLNTSRHKEEKIFNRSDAIKEKIWLPAEFDENGKRQYEKDSEIAEAKKTLTKYVKWIPNQEDDFIDYLCGQLEIYEEGTAGGVSYHSF